MLSREEFEEQFEENSEAIFRFLYWQTKDVALAEDIVSGTFERAWKARATFVEGSAKAWLYRIARNLLTDHWRKHSPMLLDDVPGLTEQLEGPSEIRDLDREQDLDRLAQALAKLPAKARLVLSLRFIEGLSAKQVAEVMDTSEGNIRVLQFRALKQIKQLLEQS